MKKTNLHKILFAGLLTAFLLSIHVADAQRYKDRDQQNNSREEREGEQENQDSLKRQSFLKRLTYGGSVDGGYFGNGGFIYLSPRVGYKLTPKWQAGIGLTYLYSSTLIPFQDPNNVNNVQYFRDVTSMYGGSVYTEYNLLQNILSNHDMLFVHLEYEALNVQYYPSPYTFDYVRHWIDDPLIGGGYRMGIGGKAYFNISALYNLNYAYNYNQGSPYTSPFILRLGVTL